MNMSQKGKTNNPNGRPKLFNDGKRRNIYMSDADWQFLTELGSGNASQGLRVAIDKVIAQSEVADKIEKSKKADQAQLDL